MKSVLRRGLIALARRLLIAAVVIGAAIAFIYVAGGTGAQTGQPQSVGPIVISHDDPSSAVPTPIPSVVAASSAPGDGARPRSTSHPPRSKSPATATRRRHRHRRRARPPRPQSASPAASGQIDATHTVRSSTPASASPVQLPIRRQPRHRRLDQPAAGARPVGGRDDRRGPRRARAASPPTPARAARSAPATGRRAASAPRPPPKSWTGSTRISTATAVS